MRGKRGALVCLALSLIGLGLCAYLAFLHIALLRGELLGGAACSAAGSVFNCHAVTASPQGAILGIPLSLLGLIGYLATVSLSFIAWQFPDWAPKALLAVAAFGLIFLAIDAALFVVMVTQIGYVCALCLATYLINLCLVLVAKTSLAQPWGQIIRQAPQALRALAPQARAAVVWVFWGIVLTGAIGTLAVHAATMYVIQGAPGALRKQMTQFVSQQRRVSVDASRDPRIGSTAATIQIVEFSDFLCPSCQSASKFTPIILAGHRKEAAFAFKHFPLDTSCNTAISRAVHPGACQVAAASECAHEQGRFWAFHDRIFEEGPKYKASRLEGDAARAGLDVDAFRSCVQSGRGLEAVKQDIAEASRLGVASTPTYFINGVAISGILTPAMFEEFLRALRQSGLPAPQKSAQ